LGVVYARRGKAMLMTATRSGGVTVAVRVSNRDAGPDRDFPDIVEIDFVARTTDLDIIDPFELTAARPARRDGRVPPGLSRSRPRLGPAERCTGGQRPSYTTAVDATRLHHIGPTPQLRSIRGAFGP
jgi:hypothetical protein